MRRGEVFWAEHPEWGRRPAVVMTRDEAIGALNEILVVLATTTIRVLPTEVRLGPEDGMPRGCTLNPDHVDTVAKGFIGDRITTLSAEKPHSVCLAPGCRHRLRMRLRSVFSAGSSNQTPPSNRPFETPPGLPSAQITYVGVITHRPQIHVRPI